MSRLLTEQFRHLGGKGVLPHSSAGPGPQQQERLAQIFPPSVSVIFIRSCALPITSCWLTPLHSNGSMISCICVKCMICWLLTSAHSCDSIIRMTIMNTVIALEHFYVPLPAFSRCPLPSTSGPQATADPLSVTVDQSVLCRALYAREWLWWPLHCLASLTWGSIEKTIY